MNYNILVIITRIKIAFKHQRNFVKISRSILGKIFLDSLKRQGYIVSYKLTEDRKNFIVFIKINSSLNSFLSRIRIISTVSRKKYLNFFEISSKYKSSDFFILNTSKGILSSEEVFFFKIGGEILCDSLSYI